MMRKLDHHEYTVGWICALRDELTAAMAMLDEPHEQLSKPRTDENSYELGRVGKHNVVLAGLPTGSTGKASAAIVATRLQSTFPSVRYVMMVGIAGGVPSQENDIRLGDIVVGIPGPKNSGVVQYDFGKTIGERIFVQTGALSPPPSGFLTAITQVRAKHRLSQYGYVQNLQNLPKELDLDFARPEKDLQFEAKYDHDPSAGTCDDCNVERLRKLKPRVFPVPHIFYGTIASADQVMRHGATRDEIAGQSGALCFEMEAAGLMNDFPCTVIRGICDYADSHKNKQWQPYAALAAAAYAKELLEAVAPEEVSRELPISSRGLESITSTSKEQSRHVKTQDSGSQQPSTQDIEKQNTTQSTDITGGFYSLLNTMVLKSDTVALGRLVRDIDVPWENFDSSGARPSDERIGISLQLRFRDILQSSVSEKESMELAGRLASILQMQDAAQALESAAEKTYVLRNTEEWLALACAQPTTRLWLEKCIRMDLSVFMIVGIHTASNFPSSANEIIIAIQYRRVVFNWLWSTDVSSAKLAREGNIWQPSFIARGPSNKAVELVEVTLGNTAEKNALPEKQVILVDGRTIVM